MASEDKRATIVDEVDDLDELFDEVLDDFSSSQTTSKLPSSNKPSGSSASPDKNSDQVDPLSQLNDDDYAKQLAADMEELVKELEGDEPMDNKTDPIELMQRLMKTFNDTGDADENDLNGAGIENNNAGRSTRESSFQDKINQTMNKLQNSSEQLDAEIIEGSNDLLMEEMMKQLESVSGLADNDIEEMFSDGGMEKMLEFMMEALATKDYLYEPMKEFAQKYPKWLEDNKGKVPPEDYTRYEKQSEYITKIIEKYDSPDFDGNNEQQNKAIINLMQELQDFGQPPPEILSELAPGMELDEQGIPKLSPSDLSSSCKSM